MKKILLFICVALTTAANAQLEKGNKLVGLQFNLVDSDTYTTYPSFSFGNGKSTMGMNIIPTYGVALERNWVVGGQATLGFLRDKQESGGSKQIRNYTDLSIGPFTRLYLDLSRNGRFKFYGMGAIEFGYHKRKYSSQYNNNPVSENSYSNGGVDASLGLGFGYFGNRIAVDLNINNLGLRLGFYLPSVNRAKK